MSDDKFRAERCALKDSVKALDSVRSVLRKKRLDMSIPYTTDRFIRAAEGAIGTALNILNGALRHLEPGAQDAAHGLERIEK